MKNQSPFPYYVGIHSLEEIATPETRVCVMNILGNESSKVTPVSHAFSRGNVVAGVQYGRTGKLETPIGDIPVYPRLAEVVKKHQFDTGVIYLPPEAVFYAVTEMCHYNPDLKKVVIITEKVSVKDQRLIRAIAQRNRIDVFGANCLGVADSWNHVRIGGALGGDRPEETLLKGSIAIHSNSGNFSTTIAEYLKTEGFGTTTIVSSGKDVIIQYAVAEFLYAAQNDPRTKAVVLYVEPGGYYEKQALDWIREKRFEFNKPIIACVTGRWKSNLTRACGHAGALAGEGDDAYSKEKWFDEYFGVPAFDPDNPGRVSERGVRVASIQHIPQAMKAVYEALGWEKDFEPRGSLMLKPWFGNDFGLNLPLKLRIPIVEAIPPYNEEIARVNKQLGASFLRQNMRNASGASRIDPKTYVAELHGKPVVELTEYPLESNMVFALTKLHPDASFLPIINLSLNYLAAPEPYLFEVVKQARANGATPNEVLTAAVSLMGDQKQFQLGRQYATALLDVFSELGVRDTEKEIDFTAAQQLAEERIPAGNGKPDDFTRHLIQRIRDSFKPSNIMQFAIRYLEEHAVEEPNLFLITAILLHMAYPSLVLKRMTRETAENMLTYLGIEAKLMVLSTLNPEKNDFIQRLISREEPARLETPFNEVAFRALFNEAPGETQLKEFSALLALTLTNGPGTLSAKGAKESVSARNHISTAFAGFLTNTGLAHGGSGYEAIEFLLDSFKGHTISDPAENREGIDVHGLAMQVAKDYLEYKNEAKLRGKLDYKRIPCINHPVFKNKLVNIDPREDYIRKRFQQEGIGNIFWDFYHELVEALYKVGASNKIYCVNIDAVIAVISLKLMWKAYHEGRLSENDLQKIGFLIFLMGRMVGVSAEIADHRDRGMDMDCRTPIHETKFIA